MNLARLNAAIRYRVPGLKPPKRKLPPTAPSGFHGDLHLQSVISGALSQADVFLETGTHLGSTVRWVGERYPDLLQHSCEPDAEFVLHARQNASNCTNLTIHEVHAEEFLQRLPDEAPIAIDGKSVWWLDAHGYGFTWPLREEVAFITGSCQSAYAFIDDFEVPGVPAFGFDAYEEQVCNWEFIADAVHDVDAVQLWYPSYTDLTSDFHPLRGWGLIVVDQDGRFEVPEALKQYGRRAI